MVLITKKLTSRALVTVLFLLVSLQCHAAYQFYAWSALPELIQPTRDAACSAFSSRSSSIASYTFTTTSTQPTTSAIAGQCTFYRSSGSVYEYQYIRFIQTSTCPTNYIESPDGLCEPPPLCPSGQVNIGTPESPDCEDICHSGASENYTMEFGNVPYAGIGSTGCGLTFDKTKQPKCVLTDPVKCTFFYTQSGEYIGSQDGQDPFEIIPLPDADPAEQTSLQEYEKTPEVVTTEPDGTVKTEFTETTTNTKDVGTEIVQIGDNLYQKNSSGEITAIEKQHIINSYTDGSSEVTINETKTSTPATIEQTIKDIFKGTTTNNTITFGNSGTLKSTITKTYSTDGKLTGTNVQTSGEINSACTGDCGDSDGDGEGGSFSADYSKGNYNQALSDTQQEIVELKQKFSDNLDQIKLEASDLLTIPFSDNGQGSLPCPDPLDLGFTQIQLCMANYEESLSILALALYFGFILLAFFFFLR